MKGKSDRIETKYKNKISEKTFGRDIFTVLCFVLTILLIFFINAERMTQNQNIKKAATRSCSKKTNLCEQKTGSRKPLTQNQ